MPVKRGKREKGEKGKRGRGKKGRAVNKRLPVSASPPLRVSASFPFSLFPLSLSPPLFQLFPSVTKSFTTALALA